MRIVNLQHAVDLYLNDDLFLNVINGGSRYTIVKDNSSPTFESRFSVYNSGSPMYRSGQDRDNLMDIVCGVLDAHGRKYWMSKSVNGDYYVKVLS